MVDRTVYANEAAMPKLNLRQIFGRQGLDTGLCRLSADKGLLTVEMFATHRTGSVLCERDSSEALGSGHVPARGRCCEPGAVGHVVGGGVAGGSGLADAVRLSACQDGRRPEQDPGALAGRSRGVSRSFCAGSPGCDLDRR